jgi:hypothetical protein
MKQRLQQLLAKESWTQKELREIRQLTYEIHKAYPDEETIIHEKDTTRGDTGIHLGSEETTQQS